MSIVTGAITPDGALIDVLVGVSSTRQKLLERKGFTVPQKVSVRAIIDTGSFATAFMPKVFTSLDLRPLGPVKVHTPSTRPGEPHTTDEFDVSVTLVSGIQEVVQLRIRAMVSDDFDDWPDAPQALIGRDVLTKCAFCYYGHAGNWTLAF
jgi:hypothetical protein